MSKIYKYKVLTAWGSIKKVFSSLDSLFAHLSKNNTLTVYEYEPEDVYETTRDLGSPFPYWVAGTKMSLNDWVLSSRKEAPSQTSKMSDEDIILNILEKSHLWRKV